MKAPKSNSRKTTEPRAKRKSVTPSAKATKSTQTSGPIAADWRTETLDEVRRLIEQADPEIVEERKWIKPSNPAGVPTWSREGIVCTGETYKQVVKLTFARGASLEDPKRLFNSSLEGNTRRAIDIREGEKLDAKAFKSLIRAAVAENLRLKAPQPKNSLKNGSKSGKIVGSMKTATDRNGKKVVLLSGGNPQIAKSDGDAPVQAYIAAMPGWKSDLGQRIDLLIESAVPQVRKAVKWNSPFYGVEGQGWFASFHVFTRYVKLTFFRGAQLQPMPPGSGKDKDARWIDLYEDDPLDEAQFTSWVKQAAAIPGWIP